MQQFLSEITEHFAKWYPKEACGLLTVYKGKMKWHPCNNVARQEDDFRFEPKQYLEIVKREDVIGIVHSHPDASYEPSISDLKTCNLVGIPYYIFSYPSMQYKITWPETLEVKFIGKDYKFGTSDCFDAARNFLGANGITLPQRSDWKDDWWEKGEDYFTEKEIKKWGFVKVQDDLKPLDLLIFKVNAPVANHCGIYKGHDVFYHHAVNRLSCNENLYPMWKKFLIGVYRHEP